MDLITTALIGLVTYTGVGMTMPDPQYPTLTVSMTGYNAVPAQTDGDPMTTASGARSNPEVVAARSVDLRDELPFGTIIEIVGTSATSSPNCAFELVEEHLGYRVIADSMHPRKKNQIDVLLPAERSVRAAGKTVNPAVALGVCKKVEVRIVGTTTIKDIPKNQATLKKIVDEQRLALKQF